MSVPVDRAQQRALTAWAAACAEHVLPLFEACAPGDTRPRQALAACRRWIDSGVFRMTEIRAASLAAHAAARTQPEHSAARNAARAAGQAVATAHVPLHALGAAWYGLKAAGAAGREGELAWQYAQLPELLRPLVRQLAAQKPALARALAYPAN